MTSSARSGRQKSAFRAHAAVNSQALALSLTVLDGIHDALKPPAGTRQLVNPRAGDVLRLPQLDCSTYTALFTQPQGGYHHGPILSDQAYRMTPSAVRLGACALLLRTSTRKRRQ